MQVTCVCIHVWVCDAAAREGERAGGGKIRKRVAHLAKASPQFTFHAVCDVIIGDGIWLLRVNLVPAETDPPDTAAGEAGRGRGTQICDQLASSSDCWPCCPLTHLQHPHARPLKTHDKPTGPGIRTLGLRCGFAVPHRCVICPFLDLRVLIFQNRDGSRMRGGPEAPI